MAGDLNTRPLADTLDTLTRRMAYVLLCCRRVFKFDQPAGYTRANTGARVEVVKVVVSWLMTAEAVAGLALENGILMLDSLFGCPIEITEPGTMGAFSFALLNPDGTGVAVTTDNVIVFVHMVDGKLTATPKESSDEKSG